MYLETERLLLRPMRDTDADAVFQMRSDADVMKFIREPQKKAEAVKWIKLVSSKWATDGIGIGAVTLKETEKLIGWCGLWTLIETGEIEIGYAIAKDYWRMGYALEASLGVFDYGFAVLNLPKIVACANPENTASRGVMEKLGMTFDHIGKYYGKDLVHYTIRKEEFYSR